MKIRRWALWVVVLLAVLVGVVIGRWIAAPKPAAVDEASAIEKTVEAKSRLDAWADERLEKRDYMPWIKWFWTGGILWISAIAIGGFLVFGLVVGVVRYNLEQARYRRLLEERKKKVRP